MAQVVPANEATIADAAARLRAGRAVAFPTETVYGLGADTFNRAALARVYELKRRPADNPLIAHVADAAMARDRIVESWDERCERLAAAFWPGPLTLVLPKNAGVPDEATGARPTIAVRSPRHPAARRLLDLFGGPVSAPSANRSGRVSPTAARHVAADFGDIDDLMVLDGGSCEVGIESTVLDVSAAVPRILRPGSVTIEMIRREIGEVAAPVIDRQGAGPGTSPRHYAPRTRTVLLEPQELVNALSDRSSRAAVLVLDRALAHACGNRAARVIVMPPDAVGYATRLFAALREADGAGADVILIEKPRESAGLWASILDRLRRACAPG